MFGHLYDFGTQALENTLPHGITGDWNTKTTLNTYYTLAIVT